MEYIKIKPFDTTIFNSLIEKVLADMRENGIDVADVDEYACAVENIQVASDKSNIVVNFKPGAKPKYTQQNDRYVLNIVYSEAQK